MKIIATLQRAQRARLASRQQPLVRLTAALQSLARRPTMLALVQPGSIDDLVRVRAVLATTLPPPRKMYEFFARRFALMKAEWEADPVAFALHVELGKEHFELIRSYVDLGDHYLAEIIGEAMGEGYFAGLSVDEALSLVNQMVNVYVNIGAMAQVMHRLSEDKQSRIVDAIFDCLSAADRGAKPLTGLRAA